MKKIAKIVSREPRFSRMLTLELSDFGIEVASELPVSSEEVQRFIVADLDAYNHKEIEELASQAAVIGYSAFYEQEIVEKASPCSAVLHRPFPIADLLDAFGQETKSQRRERKPKSPTLHKQLNYLTVDSSERTAVWGDVRIPLSENEYKVLSMLCENRGEPVERERIYALLGAEEGNMGDVYICHLRRKIDNKLGLKLIYTIRGKGYMLKN